MKKNKDWNYERQSITRFRKIYEGTKLSEIFPDGKFPEDAYIDLNHEYVYDHSCDLEVFIKWEVPETDEQYNQRIRDYEAEKARRSEVAKKSAEKRAKTLAAKAEKEKQKEIELLKKLMEKHPDVKLD